MIGIPVDWYLTGGRSKGIGKTGSSNTGNVDFENCFGMKRTPIS